MNNQNFHPEQKIPPLAHALHQWDEKTKILSYEYNGMDIISMHIPRGGEPGFRHGSDGAMQSIAFMQQIYITLEEAQWVTIRFCLSKEGINLRPNRAEKGQSILGQSGNVLMDGVNGLYDISQDLLIDFHGCPWHWAKTAFQTEDGRQIAYMNAFLGPKPFFINLRMFYYKNHLGYKYHAPWNRRPKEKAVAGWCSWEAFRRDISMEKIEAVCTFMEEKLKAYGLEYIQVDDGYQKMPLPYDPKQPMAEGWFACKEESFPKGHPQITEQIQKHGFAPAIWTNANITNEEFPVNFPDAVLFHEGKPLKGEWIDFLYNCTPETLEKHVKPIFEGFSKFGYEYVKIDAIRHLLFDGLHEAVRLGIMTNESAEQKFRSYMEATKEGLGEDIYYLASWGEMHEVVGLADACRISMDANPTWAGIRMQLFEMARWFHTQRILFLNDPDHVCVRTNLEWAKSVLSLISLSGGLYMLSDPVESYTEDKLQVIRKTLPPLKTRTGETGPLDLRFPAYTWTKLHGFAVQSHETPVEMEEVTLEDAYNMAGNYPNMEEAHPFSTLWSFHLNQNQERWCVAGRFATVPLKASSLSLTELSLDGNTDYYAFDFWEQNYMGLVRERILCKELAIGECQIIGLRKAEKYPQWIASSRHVSMDAISIAKTQREEGSLSLWLEGIANTEESYYFIIPKSFVLVTVKGEGAVCSYGMTEELLKVEVGFLEPQAVIVLQYQEVEHE